MLPVSVYACTLSHVQLCGILWAAACQAPLSMGFSRQEYWSGQSFPSPGDLPDPGIEPASQVALVAKNPSANAGDLRDMDSVPGLGSSPEGGHGNPLQHTCLESPPGQRSLAGCRPQSRTESDTTEQHRTCQGPLPASTFFPLAFLPGLRYPRRPALLLLPPSLSTVFLTH